MNKHEVDRWKERFIAQKASGLAVLQWCEKNNITKHTSLQIGRFSRVYFVSKYR